MFLYLSLFDRGHLYRVLLSKGHDRVHLLVFFNIGNSTDFSVLGMYFCYANSVVVFLLSKSLKYTYFLQLQFILNLKCICD